MTRRARILFQKNSPCQFASSHGLTKYALQYKVCVMQSNWASENLQVIRTLMERSALYRRAMAPIMLTVGVIGSLAGCIAVILKGASVSDFILFWLATGIVALGTSFLLVRRQALKDSEPFWSPPTRRVALALAPPLATGFLLACLVLIASSPGRRWPMEPSALPGLWMILYGCAIYSAGFFMARGIRLLGAIFLLCGVISIFLRSGELNVPSIMAGNISMAATFGGLHIAYGMYLYFTEKKSITT